jgi:hypothetical protein
MIFFKELLKSAVSNGTLNISNALNNQILIAVQAAAASAANAPTQQLIQTKNSSQIINQTDISSMSASASSSSTTNSDTNSSNSVQNSALSTGGGGNSSFSNGTHDKNKKNHCCPYCDRSFTRPYRLNDHISFSHTDEVMKTF